MNPSSMVRVRTSERSTFRRCRQKWHWTYQRKLQPERTKGALRFGTLVHESLEQWYIPGRNRGTHPARAFEILFDRQPMRQELWDEDGERHSPLELGITMLEEYVKTYGKEEHIEIIKPEMTFEIDIMDPSGNYLGTYCGKSDAVYRNLFTMKLGALEHKTAKRVEQIRITSGYGEQGLSYLWALNIWLKHLEYLKEDEYVDNVLFNVLRKGLPDSRPRNAQGHALNKPTKDRLIEAAEASGVVLPKRARVEDLEALLLGVGVDPATLGEPSKVQPAPLFDRQTLTVPPEALHTIDTRIRMEMWEMNRVRKGRQPIFKNPTKDCSWDCPFRDVCELHEMGRDYESTMDLEFIDWNPYSDHQLADEKG